MDLTHHKDRLLLAIPKKGRLNEKSLKVLEGSGISFHRFNRVDIVLVKNLPLALIFLPAGDIPRFVGEGNVDLGITGQDQVIESDEVESVTERIKLGFGACKLQVQTPNTSPYKSGNDLIGKRVVTSFSNIAKKYFEELEGTKDITTQIKYVGGSVEAACALGLGDGIIDLVESGETMRAAGLHAIDTVLETEAVLIQSKKVRDQTLAETIVSRIQGFITSQSYVLCQYNIRRDALASATSITPGRRAPTVTSLDDPEWCAVSAMVNKKELFGAMDKLEKSGAEDIIIMNITNFREGRGI